MKLEKEEQKIIDYIENSHPKSINNITERKAQLKDIVLQSTTKRKQINIRLLESDLEKLKSKALEEGVPYQTLINSVVHKYVNGML